MAHPFKSWAIGVLETFVDFGMGANPDERHRFRFVERAGNLRTAVGITLTSFVAGAGTTGFIGMVVDPASGAIAGPVALTAGFAVATTVWLMDVTTVEFVDRIRAESKLRWRGYEFLPTRARGLKLLSVLPLRGVQAVVTSSLAGIAMALFLFASDVNERLVDEARVANAPLMQKMRANADERVGVLKSAYERARDAVTKATDALASAAAGRADAKNLVEAARGLFDQRRHELNGNMARLMDAQSAQVATTAEAQARLSCENDLISCDAAKGPVTLKRGDGPNAKHAAADVLASQGKETKIQDSIHSLQQQIDALEVDRTDSMKAAQSREMAASEARRKVEETEKAGRDEDLRMLRKAEADALANWNAAKSSFDREVAEHAKATGDLKDPRKGLTARLWALWQLRHEPGNAATFLGLTLLAMLLELAPLITAILYATPRFGPLLEVVELERQIQDELRKDQWRNRQ